MNFHVIKAANQDLLDSAFLLREVIFINKAKWQDEYDPHSIHFLALHGKHSAPVGVVRLIQNSEVGLPVQEHFGLYINELSGEVSRWGLLPEYRGQRANIARKLLLACREEAKALGLTDLYYIRAKKMAHRIGGPTLIDGIRRYAYHYRL